MIQLPDIELINLVKNGDDLAFEHLLHRYNPLIKRLISSYHARNYDNEDFYQIAVLAFYHAVLTFSKTTSYSFYAFALSCIRNKMISVWRQIRDEIQFVTDYQDMLVVMESQPSYDSGSDILDLMNDSQIYDQRVQLDKLIANRKFFSKLEQNVLEGYISGMKRDEIASAKGLKTTQVSQALTRIKAKTRQHSASNPFDAN